METEQLHKLRAAWHDVIAMQGEAGGLKRRLLDSHMTESAERISRIQIELIHTELELSLQIASTEAQKPLECPSWAK